MENEYSSQDILKMAIQAKTKGIDLYLLLARNCGNYHVGQLFTELAKDEQHHRLQLEKLLSSMQGTAREEAYPGEKAMYLKALADSNTFACDQTCKKFLETTISEEDALKAGITFEKDFMLFLHDLKRHAAGKDSEKVVIPSWRTR